MKEPRKFNENEIKEFVKLYPNKTNKELAIIFKHNVVGIVNLARRLKLRKSSSHINSGRFQKGKSSWNKGLKLGSEWGKATQFKKGNIAHNKLPEELKSITTQLSRLKKNIKEREKRYATKQNN